MDIWARVYAGQVRFVCVGCAGGDLAVRFGEELQLRDCVISAATRSPSWGQLGCSGFIVLDSDLRVLSRKTSAYLEVREQAFRDLEAVLAEFISGIELPHAMALKGRAEQHAGMAAVDADSASEGAAHGEITPLAPLDSVLVAELDAEHDACASALERLAEERSAAALGAVIAAYQTHFAHEEALLDEHVFHHAASSEAGGFSASAGARTSHWADHARLLRDLEAEAARSKSCPAEFIDKTLRDFERHASQYDGSYAVPLSTALAAKKD